MFPEPLSPRIANYAIDVRLDTDKKILTGEQVLIWHNKSSAVVRDLQFHLYLNAFRNSESTFMREYADDWYGEREEGNWGYIDIDRFYLRYDSDDAPRSSSLKDGGTSAPRSGGYDLTGAMTFIHPDDDNQFDKTVMRVPLPKPLPPGSFVTLDIDFTARLPEPPIERTGAKKEFFLVAQWFPKIAVYDSEGWNAHQFHVETEFFADFGVYDVRMRVPADYIVGATGILAKVIDNGDGTRTHCYHAEDVHDFVWTASPEFREFTDREEDVDIRLLLQPDHSGQAERHITAAKAAIRFFQDRYGDYPFPNLTMVDPRQGADAAGGMEYPTFITIGTRYGLPGGMHELEHVIGHEFGHNYWYHLLASNEFEESWLDEGVATYTDFLFERETFGHITDLAGVKLSYRSACRQGVIFGGERDPVIRKGWQYYSRRSYSVNSYSKPGIILLTLHNVLGEDAMNEIMRTYVSRWRFKHPKSEDFFAIVNELSDRDVSDFIHQAFYTNARLDYAVSRVYSNATEMPEGYDFTRAVSPDSGVTQHHRGGEILASGTAAPTPTSAADADRDTMAPDIPQMYVSGVTVRRLQPFVFPVAIEMVFEDGQVVREIWDGQSLWKKYRYTKPARLVSATVDPEKKILLDLNFTNNSKTVESQPLGINKLSVRTLFWSQFLLDQPEMMLLVKSILGAFAF